jgi:low affinity Fe/Cu permease
MTVTEDTVERPATAQLSGPGTTTQAMRDAVKRPTTFDRFCDWVSEAMGRPPNIVFWLVLVVGWTLIFALGGPHLASGSWLPAWFTSQGYNFPLNLFTTVAELFIGFLVGTASNRSQNALTALLDKMEAQEEQIESTELSIVTLIKENNEITSEIHQLATEVAKNAAEVRNYIHSLATPAGQGGGDSSPDVPGPAATQPGSD